MPAYRRRRYSRRRRVGRRRSYSRRRGFSRRYSRRRRGPTSRYFKTCLWTGPTNVAITDTTLFGAKVFQLYEATHHTKYTQLFDQYKILKVIWTVRFQYDAPTLDPNYATVLTLPILRYAFDADDAGVPTSINQLNCSQYYHEKQLSWSKPLMLKFHPKPLFSMYETAVATGYSPKSAWISTTDSAAHHFGLKYCFDASMGGGTGLNTLGRCQLTTRYYVAFKNLKVT